MSLSGWSRPSYRVLVWDGPPDLCRGWMSPCQDQAVLNMPLPDRDFNMLYCHVHWEPMAAHLRSKGYQVDVTGEAARLLTSTAVQRVKSLWPDLSGLVLAHGLDFQTLHQQQSVPPIVARAYEEWVMAMDDLTRLVALQDGITYSTDLSENDRHRLTIRAFSLVME